MKNKLLIGITGGIGSGKSLVCSYFKKLGCEIYYADEIAKKLYTYDIKLVRAISRKFGSEILIGNKVSLQKLRSIVFKNQNNQKEVNRIVHPFVIEYILKKIKESKSSIILIEAALIFESNFHNNLDYVIHVYSNKINRYNRLKKSGNMTGKRIQNIMNLQMPELEKFKKADFIIINNSTKIELKNKVKFLYNIFKRIRR
ncbi:MAG: dephospho-CoA kinase [Ignavibacteria bacterium]